MLASRSAAASTRARSTYCAGETPTLREKTRAKCRTLIMALRAMTGTVHSARRIGVDVVEQRAQRAVRHRLRAGVHAELRLAARALQEDDQVLRDPAGQAGPWSCSTMASARSMPAVTPADVDTSPSHTKIASGSTSTPRFSSSTGERPVRRRLLALQQSRARQHHGSGADTGDPARLQREPPQVGHEHRVGRGLVVAPAADHDQRVDRTVQLAQIGARLDAHARGRGERSSPERGERDLVARLAVVGCLEHLYRSRQVQQRRAVVADHDYLPQIPHTSTFLTPA